MKLDKQDVKQTVERTGVFSGIPGFGTLRLFALSVSLVFMGGCIQGCSFTHGATKAVDYVHAVWTYVKGLEW